jgi:hypothetical protein
MTSALPLVTFPDTGTGEPHRRVALNKTCGFWINEDVGQNPQLADLEALYRARYRHFLRVAT